VNINDIVILLGLAIITLIGFAQGTIRLVIALFSFYLSIVLSSLYFRIVGAWLQRRLGTSEAAAPGVAFALILLLSFIVVVAALLYTFRYAETPRSLQVPDRVLGAVLGLVMAALVMGTYATIMRFLFIDNDLAAQATFPVVRAFQNDVRASFVIVFMLNEVLPLIFRTLDPILPDAANVFFSIR
jgi:uncharacterized membrane protein required for colicin V production